MAVTLEAVTVILSSPSSRSLLVRIPINRKKGKRKVQITTQLKHIPPGA